MKNKVLDILKSQVKSHLQDIKTTWQNDDVSLEDDLEDLKEILHCIKSNIIWVSDKNQFICSEEKQKNVPKKRGRPTKTSTLRTDPRGRSDSSETMSLNDSVSSTTSTRSRRAATQETYNICMTLNDSGSSTSSTRSRRAAAQAAEHKLAHVQSLSQLKTKLRRPTGFDEKQSKAVLSPPPAKCRRTTRNQSGGSNSVQSEEGDGSPEEEENKNEIDDEMIDNKKLDDKCLGTNCLVSVEKLNTPTINAHTRQNSRSSRSLDRAAARNSNDMFDVSVAPNSDPTHKTNKKKSMSKKDLDSGISSTEEEIQQLMKINLPMAHSSPILMESCDDVFRGFDEDQPNNNKVGKQAAVGRDNTFVVDIKTEEIRVFSKKTTKSEMEKSSSEEIEETETNVIKSRTKVLRKRGGQTAVNVEEKENVNRNNETHIITSKPENSPNSRSRSKVLKKAVDHVVKSNESDEKNSEEDVVSLSPEMKTRRTKTIRKQNEQNQELKPENETVGRGLRSRANTRNNSEKEEQSDSSDDEPSNTRSRTKTIKKAATNTATNGLNSEYLMSEFKDNLHSTKMNNRLPPISPAPAKGELVKKRVEDFEKMQSGPEEQVVEEEKTVGRITRNAVKKKVTSSATETQSSKHAKAVMQLAVKKTVRKSIDKGKRNKIKEEKENMPVSKGPLSSERPRMTPLGVNNRVTPGPDSALKTQTNKWTNSSNRPTPVETNSVTLIHKQAAEEAEKKRKEEERLKRKAKEEEAKRKKEKALKATAEEAKRKRLEKLQKVAATREAAEKEKERTAAKAEKEKEEKMRQIAIEKEKQKEEQLMKKKQLTQQKMLEHEERRRQEEAARLAKLKEQEEEHKRLLAMKEREQELLKQQKAELRLAEAEKIKHQGGKLGKLAAVNNAKLKMQGMTPSEKTNGAQSSKSYEITPAREDRPLLQPKSENDYGIDDAHSEDSSDDESQPKKMIPAWAQSKNRERLLRVNKYLPKKLWDMFMECDPCPDINQMFAGNIIKKRIRTSSAVWRTPPKYSRVAP